MTSGGNNQINQNVGHSTTGPGLLKKKKNQCNENKRMGQKGLGPKVQSSESVLMNELT